MTAKKTKKTASDASAASEEESLDFEVAMSGLDETVRRLEAGDLPLEESLAAFEKGVALVRALHARLDSVQTRIDELTGGGGEGVPALKSLAARSKLVAIDDEDDEDDFELGDDDE